MNPVYVVTQNDHDHYPPVVGVAASLAGALAMCEEHARRIHAAEDDCPISTKVDRAGMAWVARVTLDGVGKFPHYQIDREHVGAPSYLVAELRGNWTRADDPPAEAETPDFQAQRDRLARLLAWAMLRLELERRRGGIILLAWTEDAERALAEMGLYWRDLYPQEISDKVGVL